MTYKMKIIRIYKKLLNKGFFSVLIGTFLTKICTFASALFLPRLFSSKYDYGILVDVDNIFSYFLLFNGLGISNSVTRFCVRTANDNKFSEFRYVLKFGLITDLFLVLLVYLYAKIGKFNYVGEEQYFSLLALLLPLSFLLEVFQLELRSTFSNTYYAVSCFVYALLTFLLTVIIGTIAGIRGVILARYLAIVFSVSLALILLRKCGIRKDLILSASVPGRPHKIVSYGIVCMAGNISSLIMQLNEKQILSSKLKNASLIADYQVASTIMNILLFLVNAFIIFIIPYFSVHRDDMQWCSYFYKRIMRYNAMVMVPIHVAAIIFSDVILRLLYGQQFLDAGSLMRIMMIASLFQATIRGIPGNILPLLGYEKFNLSVNIIIVITHFILTDYLIDIFGINGSAVALAIAYFLCGIIYMIKIHNVLRGRTEK